MGILNAQEIFSDDQAITATAPSTNVIDFGAPGTPANANASIIDDKGNSCIPFFFQITESFNNLTSLTIEVQVDDNADFSSAKTIFTETILLADLVAGKKGSVRKIPNSSDEQYMRLNYTVNGAAPTVGKVTAGIGEVESVWGNR